ncbi:MAG: ABC transporter ATP-binding protein [Chthoniobacterales bacterium]|nr:ABC transporter ATP-binding protein [Chthoniobacterales bacterium]
MNTLPASLSISNLEVSYGEVHAVRGISLEVPSGGFVALIGANGAGKSSTLRAIAGELPARGTVLFEGRSIDPLPSEQRVHLGLNLVPEGRSIFGNLTVLENLKLGAWNTRDGNVFKQDLDRMYHLFPRLEERTKQIAGTLSGGEQQMLAVARALMTRPRLLLLDEPSMGLSPILVQEIFKILRAIHAEGMSILLVEQNANLALRYADHAYLLELGQITLSGSGQELLAHPKIRDGYLGK